MVLANTGAGQVVVVYLNRVAIFPGKVPGDYLRNLFLRLGGASTAVAVFDAGRIVEDVDDVADSAVEIHSIHLVRIVAVSIRGS